MVSERLRQKLKNNSRLLSFIQYKNKNKNGIIKQMHKYVKMWKNNSRLLSFIQYKNKNKNGIIKQMHKYAKMWKNM